jgi:L-ascorbate metabolism protein UlaG (beta-lactamase superfamily)
MADPVVKITWCGHASVGIEVNGYRIMTDPLVTPRVAHLVRRVPALAPEPADAVLLSHLHMDHLHRPSLRVVAPGARVLAPRGASPLLQGVDAADVQEIESGQSLALRTHTTVGDLTIETVHAEHHPERGPFSRRSATPVGYLVHTGGVTVYFAGDTDLFDAMSELGPIDVALLPIWGWGRTLGEKHLDPVTAATATRVTGARHVVPIHWGTYSPMRLGQGKPAWFDTPLLQFRRALAAQEIEDRLVALAPGDAVEVSRRRLARVP